MNVSVHECLFCPQTFSSAIEKDDHTLEHFAQEICTECNRNLIRIGGNLYTLHTKETCIENKLQHHINASIKTESPIGVEVSDEIEMQNEPCMSNLVFNTVDQISEPAAIQDSSDVEDVHIKIEFEPSNIQNQHESQIKIEEQFIALNDDDSQDYYDEIFSTNAEHCLDNLSTELNSEDSQSQNQLYEKGSNKREKCDVCSKTFYVGTLKRHKIR